MPAKSKKTTEEKKTTAAAATTEGRPKSERIKKAEEKKAEAVAPADKKSTKKGGKKAETTKETKETSAGVKKQKKTTEEKETKESTKKAAKAAAKKTTGKKATTEKKTKTKKAAEKEEEASPKKTAKKSTKSETAPKIEDGSLESLFSALPSTRLTELLEILRIKKSNQKQQNVSAIVAFCKEHGEREFIDQLSKEQLKVVMTKVAGEEPKHDNKGKLQHELREAFAAKGQHAVFALLTVGDLDDLCKVFDFAEEGTKEDKISGLEEEILVNGAKLALEKGAKAFVLDVAADVHAAKSGPKEAVILRILSKAFPHLSEQADELTKKGSDDKKKDEKEEDEKPVEKKPIAKGVTSDDLYQYYSEELEKFCTENNIKKSGSKKDIIKRILVFFGDNETAKEAIKAGARATGKRKRAAPKKKEEKAADASASSAPAETKEPAAKKSKK